MSQNQRKPFIAPEVDYLSKDFASFRRLMQDHIKTLIPNWEEHSLADVGHMLLDLLAYSGDYLSYYQDAVATEAYLGTARRRESIRRHTRLLDYHLHEGCNSRALVHVRVNQDVTLPVQTQFLTEAPGDTCILRDSPAYFQGIGQNSHVFESMHFATLREAHNEIRFFVPKDGSPILKAGATSAKLVDKKHLQLQVGDILILMETRNPHTGDEATANSTRRHAVQLCRVDAFDKDGEHVVEISWDASETLPFDLVLERHTENPNTPPISVAKGNILLADYGRTVGKQLPQVAPGERYTPQLTERVLTYRQPLPATYHSLHDLLHQDPRQAVPVVQLWKKGRMIAGDVNGVHLPINGDSSLIFNQEQQEMFLKQAGNYYRTTRWDVKKELLNSGPFARDFVVEIMANREAKLRFGFSGMGWRPHPQDQFTAVYRIGSGPRGNVGQGAIRHIILPAGDHGRAQAIDEVTNLLPAVGGLPRERQETAQLLAPATLSTQARCVTSEDYEYTVTQHPEVVEARAKLERDGAWQTAVIYVRRQHGRPIDSSFQRELLDYMRPSRIIGTKIQIQEPRFEGIYLHLAFQAKPQTSANSLRKDLLAAFSKTDPAGFFHPQRFKLGQSLYQSQIVAHAMSVPGLQDVKLGYFHYKPPNSMNEKSSNAGETADTVLDEVKVPPTSVLRLVELEVKQDD